MQSMSMHFVKNEVNSAASVAQKCMKVSIENTKILGFN